MYHEQKTIYFNHYRTAHTALELCGTKQTAYLPGHSFSVAGA